MAITYHFDLYPRDDPRDGTRLVRFTQLQSAEYRGEANGTGAGRISLRGSSVDAAYIDPAGLQYVRVVRDDGSTEAVVGGFFLDNGDYAALTSTGNELLTFGGAGTLSYLERAVMAPHTYISPIFTGQDPFDDTWRLYAQSTVYANGNYLGAMLWRVIYEAQHFTPGSHRHADGVTVTDTHDDDRLENALPALTMGFDAFDDSDAAAWTVTSGEFKAMVGENVISVVKRLMEAGLYVSMDPDTFELNAWEAATHGRNRTGAAWGSSVVRFQAPIGGDIDTGNIKSDAKRGIQAYVKRSAIWAGGQDVFGFSTTGGSDIPWEGFYPSDVVDVDALEYVATTQLGARSDAGDTVRLRMKLGDDPTNGRYLPFEHVQLDDAVTLHTGSGQWDWNEQTFPVAALTVMLRQGGDWDALVDLGSSYSSIAERRFQVATVPTHTHPGICFCTTTVGGTASYTEEDFLTWDSGPETWSNEYLVGSPGTSAVLTVAGTYGGVSGSNGGNFGSVGADTAKRVVTPGSTLRVSGHSAGFGQSDPCTPLGVVNFSWGVKFYDSSDVLLSTHTVGSHTTAQDAGYVGPDTLDVVVPDDAAYMVLAQHTDGSLGCQPNATHLDSVSIGTVTTSGAVQGTDEFTGSSTCAARCDHKHHGSDVILDNGDTVQEYVDSGFLGHSHDAEDVAIVDAGGYFDGTTVEAALQELGADTGATSPPENAFDGERPHGYNLTRQGLVISPAAGWKSDLVESPNVLWHPGAGKYVMVATGYDGTNERLGVWTADSPDGPWTEYGSNPFFAESGAGDDAGGVTGAYVWYEDGTSHLFYIGLTATGYEQGTKTICHATSTDWIPGTNAGTWTRLGAVISPSGSGWRQTAIWHPNIVKRGGTYYLFFNATGTVSAVSSERIGYATSPDLTTWTVDDANSPLLTVGSGWESVKLGDPYVYRIGETWYMAYEGYDGTNAGEGIAYTSDADFPLGWTKFADNPVLPHGSSGYDSLWAGRPCIWISPTKYYHWYSANDGSVRGIGLATEQQAIASGLIYLPLTTVVGGVPELVWDANNSLIPTGSIPT